MARTRVLTATLTSLLVGFFASACSVGLSNDALPQGYAIIYGVSDYQSITDLGQPDDDALAVAELLRDQGYQIISGDARVNAQATKDNLTADFQEVASRADEGSRFFFYFAGHGYGDGMEFSYGDPPFSPEWAEYLASNTHTEPDGMGVRSEFLFLHEADPFSDVELTVRESITDDELAGLLETVPSRQRVVVIDACHSGGFAGTGPAIDQAPQSYEGSGEGISFLDALSAMTLYLDYDARSRADVGEQTAVVLSAAGEQEFSYEGDWLGFDNGVFTHFFLESAHHGDQNYDGYVTVTEAYAYANARIAAIANARLSGASKFLPRVTGGPVDVVLFSSP